MLTSAPATLTDYTILGYHRWLPDLLQGELKMKLFEVEGARVPVSYSWRRNCTHAISEMAAPDDITMTLFLLRSCIIA